MRIGFDISLFHEPEPTGVAKGFRALIQQLERSKHSHELFFADPNRQLSRFERIVWREVILPRWIEEQRIDLFHSPFAAFPLLAKCKKLATVHEVPWLEPGTTRDEGRSVFHRAWAFLATEYADRVVCVSNRTAQHLQSLYPSTASKIRTCYHGVDSRFSPITNPQTLQKYRIPDHPYFLSVGKLRRKKNLLATLRSFSIWQRSSKTAANLIFVGPTGDILERAQEEAKRLQISDHVFFCGYVDENDLPTLYSHARALLHLSLSEGFGMTPIESMACGTPVIASDRGAIPEVTEGAALLVSPDFPEQVADAMHRVFSPTILRNSLVDLGKTRAAELTWEKSAQKMLEIYAEIGS